MDGALNLVPQLTILTLGAIVTLHLNPVMERSHDRDERAPYHREHRHFREHDGRDYYRERDQQRDKRDHYAAFGDHEACAAT